MANPKISEETNSKARTKLAKDLNKILVALFEGESILDFKKLGVFLNTIGIYQIIFGKDQLVTCNEEGKIIGSNPKYKSISYEERLKNEAEFQSKICKMLSRGKDKIINKEILIKILVLLYDYTGTSTDIFCSRLKGFNI